MCLGLFAISAALQEKELNPTEARDERKGMEMRLNKKSTV
jgi:hypothetical protein